MSPSKPAANARTAYLGLGSNTGDRRAHLAQALDRLNATPGVRVTAVSSLYETVPVGLTAQPDFLNAVAEVCTELPAEALLDAALAVEAALGRVRTVRWGPRPIDLDVLLVGGLRVAGGRLTLPHPRMTERAFVLVPLAEIAPGLVFNGKTAAAWAAESDASGVRRLDVAWASRT
jgi:2-amino-4-hydroxy-6-hydroxymethyldihydropteridine diphosphokinase